MGTEVINVAEVLFYERPVPLNREDHKDLRLKAVPNVRFAMNTHSVPLTGAEFGIAARDLLIIFGGSSVTDAGPIALSLGTEHLCSRVRASLSICAGRKAGSGRGR
jgi:hypothetical protein